MILIEDYDNLCINCSPYNFEVVKANNLYSLQQNWRNNHLEKDKYWKLFIDENNVEWFTQYKQHAFFQMRKAIRRGNWNENPEKYSNPCFGGSSTFVTVLYPNGEIKIIAVNCFN